MDDQLREAIASLGIERETEALQRAGDYSDGVLLDARNRLIEQVPPGDGHIDVLVLGSYARREASLTSDFDYLIVIHSLPPAEEIGRTRELTRAVEQFIDDLARTAGGETSKRPGPTGLFGTIQAAGDLVERIGLEQDTNATHTRRCLVLQESASIYREELHSHLVRSILARYLADYTEPKPGPPRFLLNDLNRYWFTVAVDYQAKRWERLSQGWGVRYLKLLISRRLSYVGSVLPLLLCSAEQPAALESLVGAYGRPPLSRIANLASRDDFQERDELRTVLRCANRFNEVLSDDTTRRELEEVGPVRPAQGAVPLFDEMHELTNELDSALRRIFTGTLLREPVDRYLIL